MKRLFLASAALITAAGSLAAQSNDFSFNEAGLRYGADAESTVNLHSYELFGHVRTPWAWQMTENLKVDLGLELAGGTVKGEDETAAYARIAPDLRISYSDFPIALIVSSGPSLYSEDTFGSLDIGGKFHFTSAAGLEWEIFEQWSLGYRFQHTSNANLDEPNPGLDMHTINLGYTF